MVRSYRNMYSHSSTYAIVTFRKVWRKANVMQVLIPDSYDHPYYISLTEYSSGTIQRSHLQLILRLSWKVQELHPAIPAHLLVETYPARCHYCLCGCYIFEVKRSINSKWANFWIVPLLHSLSNTVCTFGWNSKSNTREHDRRQHNCPAACVVVQQYSFLTFILLRFYSRNDKAGASFENITISIFYYFKISLIVKLPKFKLRTA